MPWDEGSSRVTRAFDEWQLAESDVLTFTRLGPRVLKQFYDRTWEDRATPRAILMGQAFPISFTTLSKACGRTISNGCSSAWRGAQGPVTT